MRIERAKPTVGGVTAFIAGEVSEPPCWCGLDYPNPGNLHRAECDALRDALWDLRDKLRTNWRVTR